MVSLARPELTQCKGLALAAAASPPTAAGQAARPRAKPGL